ncbi:hypothetical protein BAUCODRAFT_25140 [Baudoinia panamericana UAMH 10762]|uniref:Uncharacterized protein n=1 Tax=Baudoinia panamericana (strain UAMH 10762) TaxID=717646 RepID=M2N890_BAUPA|nr:uncharacterized protein BAUCODRAFT_25140 [Baudoinia panamericana UAMH 10762]EMC95010.1 hypothetical protein BAUCODRAFT_25140 [Baudoinia panamericana UAMH 10762]
MPACQVRTGNEKVMASARHESVDGAETDTHDGLEHPKSGSVLFATNIGGSSIATYQTRPSNRSDTYDYVQSTQHSKQIMRLLQAVILPIALSTAATAYATIPSTQPQTTFTRPTCDDNSPTAHHLFHTVDRANACYHVLETLAKEVTETRFAYLHFLNEYNTFEPIQNRLCRWQRLTQKPPETREAHEQAFKPVGKAYARAEEALGRLRKAFEMGWWFCRGEEEYMALVEGRERVEEGGGVGGHGEL